jgi:choline dehydrogenase-like flavoprotein
LYFDEVARSEHVRLVLNSTAVEIATDGPAGGVTKVVVANRRPARFSVKARYYVLAAGGIDNARLLLVSRRSQPAGLGNGEGLVGAFFMERMTGRTGFIVPATQDFFHRIAFYAQRKVDDTTVGAVLCSSADAVQREGLLQCAFYLVPDLRAGCSDGMRATANLARALRRRPLPPGITRQAATAVRGLPDVARARLRRRHHPPEVVALRVQAEQAPNPDSRVSLDRTHDEFGIPRTRLDWRIGERDRWSIRRAQDMLDAELRSRGLGRVEQRLGDESPATLFLGSYHQMGTTRMHDSPRQGVVDRDCRVNGVENLYIAGASVFPTSGFANPTLTVVALALRLADHIKERLAP